MDKKGQITLFIIIGIILLIATALIFFIKGQVTKDRIELDLQLDSVSDNDKPVQDFVLSCLNDVSKEGITRIGDHGGYTSVKNQSLTTQSFDINEQDYSESDAVALTESHYVPYWLYLKTTNDCTSCPLTTQYMPTIESMQDELEYYLSMKFRDCINDFYVFEDQGITVVEQGDPSFEVQIGESKVYISSKYPIKVSSTTSESTLENYYVEVDVRLKPMYELAKLIVEKEQELAFLESMTMNLISAYGGLDPDKLPPIYEFTDDYAVVYWVKSYVAESLQEIFNSYIPLIQLENTKNAELIKTDDDYEDSLYGNMFIANDDDYDDFSANFIYLNWPIYLDITPNKGELISPITTRTEFPYNFVPAIQTNVYESFYDVAYPAVVLIRDEEAFAGKGFNFLFAIEANVKDNMYIGTWDQLDKSYRPWDYDNVQVDIGEGVELVESIDPETNEAITKEYEPEPKKLICDQDQRISGDISFSSYDAVSGEAIPEVSITLRCGAYKNCYLASTNSHGKTTDNAPICLGGAFIFSKEGYQDAIVEYDVLPYEEGQVIGKLQPYRELEAEYKMIPTSRLNSSRSVESLKGLAFDPERTDSLIITGNKLSDHPFEKTFNVIINFNGTDAQAVNFLPGTYELNFIYMDNDGVIIPEQEIDGVDPEDGMYPEINLTPAMLGGAYLTNETGYWNISEQEIDSISNVLFYIFRMKDPINVSELEEMGQFENYSMVYREYIEPDLY